MTGSEIRARFLEHFRRLDHLEMPSASLVPHRDPTTLFNSAGMQPLKPYYQGLDTPPAARLSSSQKCFRTQDIDEVGKTDRHGTFFEMLGNFAPTGDYFKEGAIPFAWSLVTEGFELPRDRLRVTVHPTDDVAAELWRRETDVRPDWIYRNPDNWWSAGDTGPCGPDSELWWDRGRQFGCGQDDCEPDHCDRFLEFWNLVFMEFDRQADGSMPALPHPGIDTGMGLERMTSILQGVTNVFDTDLFVPIVGFVEAASARPDQVARRLLSDHLRAMTFVIADGVTPANEGRGYVLRRLIRRAALHARRVGWRGTLSDAVPVVVSVMGDRYPELAERAGYVKQVMDGETERFDRTLGQGMELFERLVARHGRTIPGEDAFQLHDTFGFPLELTRELAFERGLEVDEAGFAEAMDRQRARSRSMTGQRWQNPAGLPRTEFRGYSELAVDATRVTLLRRGGEEVAAAGEGDLVEVFLAATPFYAESGGQVGDTGVIETAGGRVRVEDTQKPADGVHAHVGTVLVGRIEVGEVVRAAVDRRRRRQVMRHHTATHLLHKALRETLGEGAVQRGSWVGPDRTTFDFPFNRPLTDEELETIGARVSTAVREALPFKETLTPYREAVASGAMHLFEEKYGEVVRVVCFGEWTCELCGGTHVTNTADVGTALITSESSIGSGLRRIEMVVGAAADALIGRRLAALAETGRGLGVQPEAVPARVAELRTQLRDAERRVNRLEDELRVAQVRGSGPEGGPRRVEGARIPVMTHAVEGADQDALRGWADRMLEALGGSGVAAVAGDGRFVIKASRDAGVDAAQLARAIGQGGGQPHLAQGRLAGTADEAFEKLVEALR